MEIKDFDSKKFFILLCLICIIFFVIIMNAFNYLPNDNENTQTIKEPINKQIEIKPEDITSEETSAKKEFNVKLPKTDYELMLEEEIVPPPGLNQDIPLPPVLNNASEDEVKPIDAPEVKKITADDCIAKAKALTNEKQYAMALKEYQKVSEMTNDVQAIASSYDGIASVYAINRRYGSALAFAIKSYNMAPTTQREMALARLYYKSGDIEKATKRINNILQRDFADDK